jgi:hypothetical protein
MKARNHFFYFLIIYSILKITDSAADPMNCLFSNSLLEDPAAAAAVSFDVTGAVGSYVITPNLYQCDPSTNSYVNYGGMASSSESVGMAYDSITNQIYLTDAREHRILQVSYRDNRHLIRVVAGDPSPGYVNGIGTLARFITPSGLAISSLTPPPSSPSAPVPAATGYGLNSTHWL